MTEVGSIITKLIDATEKNTLAWCSLEKAPNSQIKKYIEMHHKSPEVKYDDDLFGLAYVEKPLFINELRSYWTEFKTGKIYLFMMYKENSSNIYHILAIQTRYDSPIFEQNEKVQYQSDLFRLFNLVERSTSNIDDFITDFLGDTTI